MMKRRIMFAAAVTLFALSVAGEVLACGDKFLIVGRGVRYQRGYAAVYPASVLLMEKTKASDLVGPLKRAGHRVDIVKDADQVRRAIAANTYDVVLADWESAPEIQALVSSIAPAVAFVPVLDGTSKEDIEAATKAYGCPLETAKPKLNRNFLARLDDVIESKRKSKPVKCDVQ